jgi:general secretion pathway protein K
MKPGVPIRLRSARARPVDEGFILVAVLWILGALATLASIYALYLANTATGLSFAHERLRAESLAAAAVELAAYRLNAVPAPARGAFSFRLDSADIAVEFRTEAARIDLNMAAKPLLAGLFTAFGATSTSASYYADRIIGWRTASEADPQGSENDRYRMAGLAYGPRQAPFASVDELWLVLGLPPNLVERAMPYVTVFSARSEVSLPDAAPEVIAALPGMTPERLHQLLSERGAGAGEAMGPGLPAGTQQGTSRKDGAAARVTVRMRLQNGRHSSAEAVIALLAPDSPEPFHVLSWLDDFDE